MNRFALAALSAAILSGLSGCAQVSQTKQVDNAYASNSELASNLSRQMPQVNESENQDLVQIVDQPYVDTRPIEATSTADSTLNCEITFTAGPTTLLAFAQQIGRDCGVPVRVTPDAISHVNGESGAAAGPVVSSMPSAATLPLPSGDPASLTSAIAAVSGAAALSPGRDTITLPPPGYVGRVDGLLDAVTSRFGLSWSHSDRGISIHYLQTRRFSIDAFPTATTFNSSFQTGTTASTGGGNSGGGGGGGSSGGGSGGGLTGSIGSNQSTDISMQSSLYEDIEASLKAMLSPSGKVAINKSSGAVIVTDAPQVLDAIEEYLRGENRALSKQITFHVKVYQVQLNDTANANVDWNILYQRLAGDYGITSSNRTIAPRSIGTLGLNVLNTATGSAADFAGSSVLVNALSTLGKVSTVTSPSVMTQNLRTAPVQTARQVGYVPSVQTTSTANAGSQTGAQVQFLTVGFSMNLTPRILESGDIMVQMSTTISALNGITPRQVGELSVDIPDVELRKFDATVNLKSGETLVLHGFEQESASNNRQGHVSPFAWMLGGRLTNSGGRSQLVVAITPVVSG
jgi:type IVB pilus formation R64 PilN family outer membrane protein